MEFEVDPRWFTASDRKERPLRADERAFNPDINAAPGETEPEVAGLIRPASGLALQNPELDVAEEDAALSLALAGADLDSVYSGLDQQDQDATRPDVMPVEAPEAVPDETLQPEAAEKAEADDMSETDDASEADDASDDETLRSWQDMEPDPVFAAAVDSAISAGLEDLGDMPLEELFETSTPSPALRINAEAVRQQAAYLKDANLSDVEKYARLKNIPVETAAYASETARAEAIAQALAENENLTRWASKSAVNSRLAVDNIEQMGKIAQAFQTGANFQAVKKKWQDYGGIRQLGSDLWLGIYDTANVALPSLYNGSIELLKSVYAIPLSAAEIFANDSSLAAFLREGVAAVERLKVEVPKTHNMLGDFSKMVWENVPQLIEQWGLAALGMLRAAGTGARALTASQRAAQISAGVKLSGYAMFANIYGLSYLQNRELGASPENSAFMAGVNALIQMRMENMGLQAIFGEQAGKKTAANIARAGLRGAGIEGTTEALQEIPESLTRKWAESTKEFDEFGNRFAYFTQEIFDFDNFSRFCQDAVLSGLVGAALGGPAGSLHYAIAAETPAIADVAQAAAERVAGITERLSLQAALDQAMDQARQSQAGSNGDISGLAAMIEQTVPESSRSLYMDPADLNQLLNLHGPSLAGVFNMEQSAIDEAIANGEMLEVQTASVVAAAADPALANVAAEAARRLRQHAAGPNFIESKSFDPAAASQALLAVFYNTGTVEDEELTALFGKEGLAQIRLSEAQDQRDAQSRLNHELNRFQRELTNEGTLTVEASRRVVQLYRAYALNMRSQFGLDAAEFLRRMVAEHGGVAQVGGGGQTVLGRIFFNPSKTVISLFDGADLVTVLHESGHNFFEHVARISQDNGSIAFAALYNQLRQLTQGHDDIYDDALLQLEALASGASTDYESYIQGFTAYFHRLSQDLSSEIRQKRQYLQKQQNALAVSQSPFTANLTQQINDTDQQIRQLEARRRAVNRLVFHGRDAGLRIANIARAKADFDIFSSYAGVDPAEARDAVATLLEHQTRQVNDPLYDPLMNKFAVDDASIVYRKLHEAAANGFSDYMAHGIAPSPGLAGIFGRMKVWLKRLYGSRKAFGQPMTAEVERAFHRWFADDETIQRMLPYGSGLASGIISMPGLSRQDIDQLTNILNSMDTKREQLIAQIQKDMRNFEQRREKEIAAEMAAEGFWKFCREYCIERKMLTSLLGRRRAAQLYKVFPEFCDRSRPEIYRADLSSLRLPQDHRKVANMVYDTFVTRNLNFDRELEARLQKETTEFFKGKMAALANMDAQTLGQALPTADRVALRKMMADHFQSAHDLDAWIDSMQVPSHILAAQADKLLAGKPLRKLTPHALMKEVKRWIALRDDAVKNLNVVEAMKAMNGLRLANAMFQRATQIRIDTEKTRQRIMRICQSTPGRYPADIVEAMRKVIEGYNLGKIRQPVDPARASKSLRELLDEVNNNLMGNVSLFADWLLDSENPLFDPSRPEGPGNRREMPKSFDDWTPEIINEIDGFLKHMLHHARDLNKRAEQEEEARISATAQAICERLDQLPPHTVSKNKMLRTLNSFLRGAGDWSHNLVVICRWIDGLRNPTGSGKPLEMETLGLQAVQAERRTHERMDGLMRRLMPQIHTLQQTLERLQNLDICQNDELLPTDPAGQAVQAPALIQQTYGVKGIPPSMLVAMLLNLGNESNISRIISGYPDITYNHIATWFGEDVAEHVSRFVEFEDKPQIPVPAPARREGLFKPADWKAAQNIWDIIASQWPEISETHEKVHGFKPPAVSPEPLRINCGGQILQLAGGYYPVKFDPEISQDINKMSDRELARFRLDNIAQRPCPRKGFTITRVSHTRFPLKLSFDIIAEHINDTSRYIEFAPILREMDNITSRPDVVNSLKRVYDNEFVNNVRPALARCVLKEPARTPLARLNRATRPYFVTYALGLNLRVALMQPMAVFSAMRDVGVKYIMRSLGYVITHGPSVFRQIAQVSSYYRDRVYSWDQDLQRTSSSISLEPKKTWVYKGREWSWADIADAAMIMIQWMDQFATGVVFLAGYMRHMDEAGQPFSLPKAGIGQTLKTMGQDISAAAESLIPRPSEFYWNPEDAPVRMTRQEQREQKINSFQPAVKIFDIFNAEHDRAVARANQFVKESNPDFDATSTTRFGSGQGIESVINQFSSAVTQLTSRFVTSLEAWRKGQSSGLEVFKTVGFDTILPTLYMITIFGLARGYLKDDDPEEAYKFMLATLMENASVMVPLVGRPFGDVLLSAFNSNQFYGRRGMDMSINFPFTVAQDAARGFGKLISTKEMTDRDKEQVIRSVCELLDVFSRFPVTKNYWKYRKAEEQKAKGKGTWAGAISPR